MATLLVPLDFSDATEPLLREATKLAAALHSDILLLHVVEPVATYVPVGASMDVLAASPATGPQDTSQAQRRLDSVADGLRGQIPTVRAEVVVGLAVEEILARAEAETECTIVMGSHGHGALYHLFSGSVVNGILKRAKCPVHIVPVSSKS